MAMLGGVRSGGNCKVRGRMGTRGVNPLKENGWFGINLKGIALLELVHSKKGAQAQRYKFKGICAVGTGT